MSTKTGVELIAEERARQIAVEGWTPEHDDAHDQGELAIAASCYCLVPGKRPLVPYLWPWHLDWWKPTPLNRTRELVKAGALIAAEIDRLTRARPDLLPEIEERAEKKDA